MDQTPINIAVSKLSLKKFIVTQEGAVFTNYEKFILNIDFKLDFVKKSEKSLVCILGAEIGNRMLEDQTTKLATIVMETDFYIENLEKLTVAKEDGKTYVQRILANILFDIAYNQLRGAWVALTSEDPMEWIVLPLITGEMAFRDATELQTRPS